jgi:hypothetical protein
VSVPDNKRNLRKRLQAPLKFVTAGLDPKNYSEDRMKALEESILADLVGDEPKLPKPHSHLSKATTHLNYSILHLHSSIGRFATYRTMFKHYPWRGKISKSDHILSVYYLFVHECYILEERLKSFFRTAEAFAKEQNIEIDMKSISKIVIKLHSAAFSSAIRSRGVHVHQDDFAPRDIKRISLFELVLLGKQIDEKLKNMLVYLQRSAIRDAKKNWMLQCDNAERASQTIVAFAFDATAAVWKRLGQANKARQRGVDA